MYLYVLKRPRVINIFSYLHERRISCHLSSTLHLVCELAVSKSRDSRRRRSPNHAAITQSNGEQIFRRISKSSVSPCFGAQFKKRGKVIRRNVTFLCCSVLLVTGNGWTSLCRAGKPLHSM